MSELLDVDPFEVRRVLRPPAALRAFNEAGVLAPADVHVAVRLLTLAGEKDRALTNLERVSFFPPVPISKTRPRSVSTDAGGHLRPDSSPMTPRGLEARRRV